MILAYLDENDKTKDMKKREVFEKLLKEQGLELETEYKTVSDVLLFFQIFSRIQILLSGYSIY